MPDAYRGSCAKYSNIRLVYWIFKGNKSDSSPACGGRIWIWQKLEGNKQVSLQVTEKRAHSSSADLLVGVEWRCSQQFFCRVRVEQQFQDKKKH